MFCIGFFVDFFHRHCAVLRKAFMLALSYAVVYGTAVLLANKTSFILEDHLNESVSPEV